MSIVQWKSRFSSGQLHGILTLFYNEAVMLKQHIELCSQGVQVICACHQQVVKSDMSAVEGEVLRL